METRMKKIFGGLAAGAAVLVLAACLLPAGSGEGLNDIGEDTVGTGALGPVDTNLTYVVNTILKSKCQGCHGTNPAGGAVVFSSVAQARATLFNSDSTPRLTTELPGTFPFYRVVPGSPDSSYLYQKIFSATPKSGVRMPENGPYLTAAQINVIRRWIEKGASLQ
jgi:hypothetical protein